MQQQPPSSVRYTVIALIVLGWIVTVILVINALERIRQVPGWQNFLGGV